MKFRLTKAEFEKLSAELQKLYKQDGEEYQLQVEGLPTHKGDDDPGELRRARDREKERAKAAEKERDELKAKFDEMDTSAARKAGDIVTLEKSWRDKHEKLERDAKAENDKLQNHLREVLVDKLAIELATKLAGEDAPVLLPHIRTRLKADFDGDRAETRVLDQDGKPSALTIQELEQEFVANKKFSKIIIGSKASGGANGNQRTNRSAVPTKKFHELTEQERKDWFNSDPEGFRRAARESQASSRAVTF